METDIGTYASIKEWKVKNISSFLDDTVSLNKFHDQVMCKVFDIAIGRVNKGSPPCEFSWFITGSGGRFEQGVISDQDHGLIYAISNVENDIYFKKLGEEVSYGLFIVGYPYCKGNVMSSNSLWCKSMHEWKAQLLKWMEDESWDAIRYVQIFYDARVLTGRNFFVEELKMVIYQYQLKNQTVLKRFMANVTHVKNIIGPLGQILVEQHGMYQGSVNLKYAAFLPYVNAIRVLSIKEGVSETSTLDRMKCLKQTKDYSKALKGCEDNFLTLLKYRLTLFQVESYTDTHYLNIESLQKEQRKEIKRILKDGKKLHDYVIAIIDKGC
ncbi:DUF294 nucleotidyltransferase-like domain-containing protein [Viridibacillus sp. NPDC093762]|uniref:DUF294 nucleotidyltransferase-like domain-containing protein n=1 Tax=Viridibacillus sp. NPDC093762 TaxID=3390720 RepID=UPI003CFD6AAE